MSFRYAGSIISTCVPNDNKNPISHSSSGIGNPNDEIFSDKVAALFSMAYKIKMAYKALAEKSNEITDYTVYPLEEIWNMVISVWGKNTVKYI